VSIKYLKLVVSAVDGVIQAKGVDEHFPFE